MPYLEQLNAVSMLSAMDLLNKPFEEPFRNFLSATIANKSQHVRFLNMLSMLEHIGSRKIMLSQMKGILTQDILKHLAEETRHAFFFKREAEKLLGKAIEGYPASETLCVSTGALYFGKLDSQLTSVIPPDAHRETGYLWVTLIVELRAVWVYRLYQEALSAAGSSFSLRSILAEEDQHLSDMTDRLREIEFDVTDALDTAHALEAKLFRNFLHALQKTVANSDVISELKTG